ncbi:MAG: hypothetical protein AABX71_02415, partial [Nanoarchaeota archaeon]
NEEYATSILRTAGEIGYFKKYAGDDAETNAVKRLVIEGKISLRGAETAYSNFIAGRKISMNPELTPRELAHISDNREDVFLNIIAKQEDPLLVVIYGGRHAWGGSASCGADYLFKDRLSSRDNIALWNSLYPSKKCSLIEITPPSY